MLDEASRRQAKLARGRSLQPLPRRSLIRENGVTKKQIAEMKSRNAPDGGSQIIQIVSEKEQDKERERLVDTGKWVADARVISLVEKRDELRMQLIETERIISESRVEFQNLSEQLNAPSSSQMKGTKEEETNVSFDEHLGALTTYAERHSSSETR